jgi:hypothetical protein
MEMWFTKFVRFWVMVIFLLFLLKSLNVLLKEVMVNPLTVGHYAFLFWFHLTDQVGYSMMDSCPLGLNCLNVRLLPCFVGPL